MKKIIILVPLFLFIWCAFAQASPNQMLDINTRKTFELKIKTLFEQEKFNELEKIAKELRDKKSCFPEGVRKLQYFYNPFQLNEPATEQDYKNLFRLLNRWAEKYPNSITQRVAEADVWLSYGWHARGSGWANTVTEEGWQLLEARSKKAYEILTQTNISQTGDCPERYTSLLSACIGQGWDRAKYEAIFKSAVSYDPAYYHNYCMTASNLTPRWGGAPGEWQQFAEDAVKMTPKSEGMTAYTRILWALWNAGEWKTFNDPGVSWEKMKQGFLDIEKNFPHSRWNLNSFAFFAALAGDLETKHTLFKKIGDDPYLAVWGDKEFYHVYYGVQEKAGQAAMATAVPDSPSKPEKTGVVAPAKKKRTASPSKSPYKPGNTIAESVDLVPQTTVSDGPCPPVAPGEAEKPFVEMGKTILKKPASEGAVKSLDTAARPKVPLEPEASILSAGFIAPALSNAVGIAGTPIEGRSVFAAGDEVYVKPAQGIKKGDRFMVVRDMGGVEHPATGKEIGHVVKVTGVLLINNEKDGFLVGVIEQSFSDTKLSDTLIPYVEQPLIFEPAPKNPKLKGVWGYVVSSREKREITEQHGIVYIDMGSKDGVRPGDEFVVRRSDTSGKEYALPDIEVGELQVVSVQAGTATARVMVSKEAVRPGYRIYYKD